VSSRSDVLISVNDLPDAVNEGAQVLDVRWKLGEPHGAGYQRFLEGHLPPARFLDLEQVLTGPLTDPTLGRHPLPDADRLAEGLGALGIDPAREIIVYDEPGSFAAGRAWWVLRWAGLNVRVLDGGITAWLAADAFLREGEPAPIEPTQLQLTLGHLPTMTADDLADFDGVIVDVRAGERYRGEVEPIDAKAGHVPGAINRPVGKLWDDKGLLPEPDALLDALDLPAEVYAGTRPIAVYCGSGVSAAQSLLALASLGVNAVLYPPSWSGWSSDPARPVATGADA